MNSSKIRFVPGAMIGMICSAIFSMACLADSSSLELTILPSSKVVLKGSAVIRNWECHSQTINGSFTVDTDLESLCSLMDKIIHASEEELRAIQLQITQANIKKANAWLEIPTRSLVNGDRWMERDMYHALKSDYFPNMNFEFSAIKTIQNKKGSKAFSIGVEGFLEIAGVRKLKTFEVFVEQEGETKFHIAAHHRFTMTEFGVTPPSALFGLVRAQDSVDVFFDLYFGVQLW